MRDRLAGRRGYPSVSMVAMRSVGIIPARYGSTRFPGKPLAPIAGRPMVQHVYERAVRASSLSEVRVATDDDRIAEACRGFGAAVAMTSSTHPTGTDRLAEAAAEMECDIVVNIQGDEPLIDPDLIDRCVEALAEDPDVEMATVVHPAGADAGNDPNRVKVVLDGRDRALYFSRSPIPARRDTPASLPKDRYLQHVGLYAYRRDFLLEFVKLPQTPLELSESLEQLRALEHGFGIRTVVVEGWESMAVDIPEDIERVEQTIRESETSSP